MLRLKEVRVAQGKTQQDVADYLGITRGAYTNIENHKREPDLDTLKRLAAFFRTTMSYLLSETDDPTPIGEESTPSFTFEQMQAMAAKEGITLTRRDELDITKRIKELHDDLANPDTLMMSGGEKLDEESRQALLQLLEQVEIMSKILAKKKFTPKKYRKSENP